MTYKKESNIQNSVRLALSEAGVLNFRNNVGAYKSSLGHYIQFGVGEKGGSDLICLTPVTITQDMVGQTLGVFTAIEVKTKTGRTTKEQDRFIDTIKRNGGLAGVARSAEDALKIINRK